VSKSPAESVAASVRSVGRSSNVAESAVITLLGAADRSLLCAFDTADRRLATIISKNEEIPEKRQKIQSLED
jgi:hypothetical protein